MPASPCLSPFSLSVVDHYADETENDESRLVSLGPTVDKRATPARRKEHWIAVAGNRTVIPDNRIPKKRRAELPASPCLSPFSLSAVRLYADETENDESCLVSLGRGITLSLDCSARLW